MAAAEMECAVPTIDTTVSLPQDPVQRLDAIMGQAPGSEWSKLRAVLLRCPAWVREVICSALDQEAGLSFQHVAGLAQVLKDIQSGLCSLLESEDAAQLNQLVQDIQPSSLNALQGEADRIDQCIADLRRAVEVEDIQEVQRLVQLLVQRSNRFRDRFTELRPRLDRLRTELLKTCAKCADGAKKSDELVAETEKRSDRWLFLLFLVECLMFVIGLAACGVPVAMIAYDKLRVTMTRMALEPAMAALSTTQKMAAIAAAAAKATAAGSAAATAAAGTTTALAAGAITALATGVTGLGAPAATFLGSQVLGNLGVGLGLIAPPAAPAGVTVGLAAAVAGAVKLILAATSQVAAPQAVIAAPDMAAAAAAAEAAHAADNVNSIKNAIATLVAHADGISKTLVFFLPTGALLMALALLGYAGRDLVKKLLGQLWAAEIQQLKNTKAAFQLVEQFARAAAEKLGTICEKNRNMEECLDIVVGAALTLQVTAQEAPLRRPEERIHDTLHEQVEQLCSKWNDLPRAFEELCSSLREFDPQQGVHHLAFGAFLPERSLEDIRPAVTLQLHGADQAQESPLDTQIEEHAEVEEQESPIDPVVGDAPASNLPTSNEEEGGAALDESTEKKSRHHIYKSKTCGYFCWDCKRKSGDIQWLNAQTCLPQELKAPPGDDEEVPTPREGEDAYLQDALEQAPTRASLRELQEEEALQVTSACANNVETRPMIQLFASVPAQQAVQNSQAEAFQGIAQINYDAHWPAVVPTIEEFPPQLVLEVEEQELPVVEEGWILIPSDSDCLPKNTYLLVPVADAARLGSILAAGPRGMQMIRVRSGGPADRSMRQFCVGGSSVRFTANHPLRVLRSGNWTLEQASTIRGGDLVNTLHGLEAVEPVGDIQQSSEEVFSLDVRDGGEVYVCTPTQHGNGQWSWAGVAVLESARKGTRSAPPHGRWAPPLEGLPLPSKGSWDCKAKRGERCTNMCTKFIRGNCLEGSDCRFCHFPHPGEPKRLPRGPRDGRSSQSG